MDNDTKALIAGVAVVLIVVAGIILYASLTIHSTGEIITVGIAADIASIDWGTLYPNTTAQVVVNFWGNGTVPITMTLNAMNWEPVEASNYLAFTWNYTGEPIGADPIPVAITLHVDEGITGFRYFNVNILVQAKEYT